MRENAALGALVAVPVAVVLLVAGQLWVAAIFDGVAFEAAWILMAIVLRRGRRRTRR